MSTTDYGTDVSAYPDLDPTFTVISGKQVVAEAVARAWQTPRGLCEDDPNAGTDVRLWLNRAWTRKTMFDLQQALIREAEKDERVDACYITIEPNPAARTVTITADITTLDGPFQMVLAISSVSLTVLGIS